MFKLFIILILFPYFLLSETKTIVFAPLLIKDVKTIQIEFSPMIKYLEKKLNRKIKLDYNTNYEQVVQKFIDGKIDIAYLGPLPFLSLESKYSNTIPLVNFKNEDNDISYTCSFVSFITNEFPIEGTKNTNIALTQALSTCGYLYVSDVLSKSNIDIEDNNYKYLQRHDQVALSIITDKFKYGGLKTNIAKEYYHLGLKEIKRSSSIPNFVLVANSKTLNKKTISNIKKAMLLVDKNELSTWPKNLKFGTKETNINDYNDLRKRMKLVKIPQVGNFDEK